MSSLTANFDELLERVRHGRDFMQASYEPMFGDNWFSGLATIRIPVFGIGFEVLSDMGLLSVPASCAGYFTW